MSNKIFTGGRWYGWGRWEWYCCAGGGANWAVCGGACGGGAPVGPAAAAGKKAGLTCGAGCPGAPIPTPV